MFPHYAKITGLCGFIPRKCILFCFFAWCLSLGHCTCVYRPELYTSAEQDRLHSLQGVFLSSASLLSSQVIGYVCIHPNFNCGQKSHLLPLPEASPSLSVHLNGS